MNDPEETAESPVVKISMRDLQKISRCLCPQCRDQFANDLSEVLATNERDRLERARKECADQQEAELKRREFLSGD